MTPEEISVADLETVESRIAEVLAGLKAIDAVTDWTPELRADWDRLANEADRLTVRKARLLATAISEMASNLANLVEVLARVDR